MLEKIGNRTIQLDCNRVIFVIVMFVVGGNGVKKWKSGVNNTLRRFTLHSWATPALAASAPNLSLPRKKSRRCVRLLGTPLTISSHQSHFVPRSPPLISICQLRTFLIECNYSYTIVVTASTPI